MSLVTPASRKRRRGVVLALVAVCLVLLIAIIALVVDGGELLDERRHAQVVADAAALAAAADLFKNYPTHHGVDPGSAVESALAVAAENGYDNDGATSEVTVSIPPLTGDHVGQAGYAEVTVLYRHPRSFSTIFGSGPLPVQARAVARGQYLPIPNGILVLDRATPSALKSGGNGTATVQGASVVVNSAASAAATASGANARLVAATGFYIQGGYNGTLGPVGSGNQFQGPMTVGIAPVPDPLQYLPPPDKATLPVGTATVKSGITYLTPGVFPGGLSYSGQTSVVMAPGIYYMDAGGFQFSGQGNLSASGVMIYNAPFGGGKSMDIQVTGQGNITISPPTSGPYKGISFFQDRTSSVPMTISGNATCTITGTVYAAAAAVSITGNGEARLASQYISRTLTLGGNGNFSIIWNPDAIPSTRIVQLVE